MIVAFLLGDELLLDILSLYSSSRLI